MLRLAIIASVGSPLVAEVGTSIGSLAAQNASFGLVVAMSWRF
jgi:hypothetical protein